MFQQSQETSRHSITADFSPSLSERISRAFGALDINGWLETFVKNAPSREKAKKASSELQRQSTRTVVPELNLDLLVLPTTAAVSAAREQIFNRDPRMDPAIGAVARLHAGLGTARAGFQHDFDNPQRGLP